MASGFRIAAGDLKARGGGDDVIRGGPGFTSQGIGCGMDGFVAGPGVVKSESARRQDRRQEHDYYDK